MSSPVIALKDIAVQYNDRVRLSFPEFTLEEGEHCLVLGESGSGKSTLLHVMCGLLKPKQGEVILRDVNLYKLRARQMDHFRGRNIGFIFQEAHLIKSLTVLENLQIVSWLAGLKGNPDELQLLLKRLNIADKASSYPFELSRGQLQRAAIARALVNKPALLVADEPTSSLDDRNTALVIELLLKQAATYGAALVIATHDKRIKAKFSSTYKL